MNGRKPPITRSGPCPVGDCGEAWATLLARQVAAEVLGYDGKSAEGILNGRADDWDVIRVGRSIALRARAKEQGDG